MRFKVKNLKNQSVEIEAVSPAEIVEKRANGEMTSQSAIEAFRTLLGEKFPQSKIQGLIEDISQAMDVKASKTGLYETPNWSVRYKMLRDIMKILNITSVDRNTPAGMRPTSVQLNVITHSNIAERVEKTA